MTPQDFRTAALKNLTDETGVYALCDLDGVPIYIGQSVDGIRTRVRRHLTSARSDIIANRQIDVWEIAFVWAWPVADVTQIPALEGHLFAVFDAQKPLMNGKTLTAGHLPDLPDKSIVQVIEEDERVNRLVPSVRLPRQISQYLRLVDYILTVKDAPHLKRSLSAHIARLSDYHEKFLN
ncbi:GIY-YIG nuclease family protein [uncultured Sulfitobacter sp.]|uniref:GIY-YIG nuclease family protein n=1 Tax=uncultured Sulfitobacter sp. TaxID=191468 RepID=UPI002607178D|nr:GIY-YIG nuclease family protein [uncultured Sulfitobacter sp.]